MARLWASEHLFPQIPTHKQIEFDTNLLGAFYCVSRPAIKQIARLTDH